MKDILGVLFTIALASAISLGIIYYVIPAIRTAAKQPPTVEASAVELLLAKDSCGVKVFKVTYKGKDYLVNNQGGIVQVPE